MDGRNGTARHGNKIAMMSPWYCRRRSLTSCLPCVQCFLAPVTSLPPAAAVTRNDTPASLHCSVNLASFQGIQFSSSFCTKYVIAIRARNTFHHHQHQHHRRQRRCPRLYIVRCSSAMSDIRHPFMDHKARLTFSARSCFLAVGTAVTVNEFSDRKVSNKSLTETRVLRHRRARHAEGAFGDFAATILL